VRLGFFLGRSCEKMCDLAMHKWRVSRAFLKIWAKSGLRSVAVKWVFVKVRMDDGCTFHGSDEAGTSLLLS
jgi:hypothetical protein